MTLYRKSFLVTGTKGHFSDDKIITQFNNHTYKEMQFPPIRLGKKEKRGVGGWQLTLWVRKENKHSHTLLVGGQKGGIFPMETNVLISDKMKNAITLWPSNTTRKLFQRHQLKLLNVLLVKLSLAALFLIAKDNKQTTLWIRSHMSEIILIIISVEW